MMNSTIALPTVYDVVDHVEDLAVFPDQFQRTLKHDRGLAVDVHRGVQRADAGQAKTGAERRVVEYDVDRQLVTVDECSQAVRFLVTSHLCASIHTQWCISISRWRN